LAAAALRTPLAARCSYIILGAACNALVIAVNGGVMPVIGSDVEGGHWWNPLVHYERATEEHHLLVLADYPHLLGSSIGDMLILGGVLMLLVGLVGLRRRRQEATEFALREAAANQRPLVDSD